MRILYITFMEPSTRFGGGIGVIKSLIALSRLGQVDYIGPEIKEDIKGIDLSRTVFLSPNNSKVKRIVNYVFSGSASSFIDSWNQAVLTIRPQDYDLIYMERTIQGFAARWAASTGLPFMIMSHNVENDYFEAIYQKKKSLQHYLQITSARKNEKICVNSCQKLIALTNNDKKRFSALYGNEEKIAVIPVCTPKPEGIKPYQPGKKYILLSGSLWFGSNVEGAIWFIKNVWSALYQDIGGEFDLVLAGSNPNDEIVKLSKSVPGITIVKNPDSVFPYYAGASMMVAPIFTGGGMKVKISEALSCGATIVTTSHAGIGYEKVHDLINFADDSSAFIKKIKSVIETKSYMDEQKKMQRIHAFDQYYSDQAFLGYISQAIRSLTEKNMAGKA